MYVPVQVFGQFRQRDHILNPYICDNTEYAFEKMNSDGHMKNKCISSAITPRTGDDGSTQFPPCCYILGSNAGSYVIAGDPLRMISLPPICPITVLATSRALEKHVATCTFVSLKRVENYSNKFKMRSFDSSKLTKKSSGTGKLMSDKSVKQYIYGDFNDGFKLYNWIVESYVNIPNYLMMMLYHGPMLTL